MAEFDPYGESEKHIVTARLSLRPSDALKEVIEPFYRPNVAEERLARLALRSSVGVPLGVLSGRQFVYENPRYPGKNSIQEYEWFQQHHVRPIVGHQLPLLARANVLQSKSSGAMRLKLQVGLNAIEQTHLAHLEAFRQVATRPILDAQLDIRSTDVVPSIDMLRGAVQGLQSALGVNHPARKGQLPHQRYAGGGYHATIDSEQLTFRIGEE